MNGMVYPIILENKTVLQLKKNVLSFIKDNQNIYISICIYFCYILISGGIPSMVHWRFWLSPSPQRFFFLIVVLAYFISLFACNVVE